jgi:hypothetical protein
LNAINARAELEIVLGALESEKNGKRVYLNKGK